jgi:hypothetical protein
VKDGFFWPAVGDVVEVCELANVGSGSSGTLPMSLFPYAGVEKVRWLDCVEFGVLVLLVDGWKDGLLRSTLGIASVGTLV